MGTGTVDGSFWALGKNWFNFLASGISGDLGYVVAYVSDDLLTSRSPSAPYAASLTASKGRLIR